MVKYEFKDNNTDISTPAIIDIVIYMSILMLISIFDGYSDYLRISIGWVGVLILFTLINDYVKYEVLHKYSKSVSYKTLAIYTIGSVTTYISILLMFILNILSVYKYQCCI